MARYVLRILDVGDIYYLIAVALAVVLWALLWNKNRKKRMAITILLPYMFLVVATTIITRKASSNSHPILEPFWSIEAILTGGRKKAWLALQVILNILMLMPVGLLAPALFEKRKGAKTVLLGLGSSITIELTQMLTRRGFAEIDDLISNTLGVIIGYGIYRIYKRKRDNVGQ